MRLFLCYRRGVTNGVTGRIVDHLQQRFEEVFHDVISIPIGVPFDAYIEGQVSKADVLVAVIGPDWVSERRSLHREEDYVRLELEVINDN